MDIFRYKKLVTTSLLVILLSSLAIIFQIDRPQASPIHLEKNHLQSDGHDGCGLNPKGLTKLLERTPGYKKGHSVDALVEGRQKVEIIAGEINILFQAGLEDQGLGRISTEEDLQLLSHNKQIGVYTFSAPLRGQKLKKLCRKLRSYPETQIVEPNYAARTSLVPQDTHYEQYFKWGSQTLRLEKAWDRTTGSSSVLVAVLDTGIDASHEDLQGRIDSRGWDYVHGDSQPEDDAGHGTAMAGIIAAEGNNQKGIAGVSWQARILPIKVADHQGVASFSHLAQGITYSADQGAQIINLSLGALKDSPILRKAVQYAYQKGAILIGAAGNDMVHQDRYPARYPEVLSVASVGPKGDLGLVTNLSETTDIAAPGEMIWSTIPGNLYALVEGTSVSAAFTSGAAALILSQNPHLKADQVYEILRQSTQMIPSLAGQGGRFDFGRLDIPLALTRSKGAYYDMAITDLEILPTRPRAGQKMDLSFRLHNQGTEDLSSQSYSVILDGQTIHTGQSPSLTSGKKKKILLTLDAGLQGQHNLEVKIAPFSKETERGDNSQTLTYQAVNQSYRDLEITDLSLASTPVIGSSVTLEARILNRGNEGASQVTVDGQVEGQPLASQTISLGAGEEKTVTFQWSAPSSVPKHILSYRVEVAPLTGETKTYNNKGGRDFLLYDPVIDNPEVHYAQKGWIDLNGDAPFRIIPGRTYVPILLFIPDKGSKSTKSYLEIDKITITMKDNPQKSASGTVIYEDSFSSAPTQTTAGMEIVDEMGQILTSNNAPDLNIFQDRKLKIRGRHNVLRFPRTSLGIPLLPNQMVEKYFAMDIEWSYHRHLFWNFYIVRRDDYHKTMKVRFPSHELPHMPGEGKYYDVHHHTVAEWKFAPLYKLLAPKKDWGGPIQMIKENAYAWGFIDNVNDIKGNIITTDHNTFYNEKKVPADSADRPPVGPTSPMANRKPGGGYYSEYEAYKRLFGITAGEEVAFTRFPLGAHMLVYRAQHFDGNWYGGSLPVIGKNKLPLDTVFDTMAKKNRSQNRHSFSYAAHPFSSQGWGEDNLEKSLGINPQFRDRRYVHDQQNEFVFKGLEFFNGKNDRSLPSKSINFDNLNPFVNSNWQKGNDNWDKSVQEGLVKWHEYLSKLMKFSFNKTPQQKFIRKVYMSAGSDAHGSFNYKDSRLATILPLQSTYSAGANAWGRARTYVRGNGKVGKTPKERAFKAYEDGNAVVTDGPLLWVSLDSNGYFDSQNLVWHDQQKAGTDDDGRIGGGGTGFDGEGTCLVVWGSPHSVFRYRYENTAEFGSNNGQITSIKIYKDEPGKPNPTKSRGSFNQPIGIGSLLPGGRGLDLEEALDPSQEGTFTDVTALSFGAFTGGDPDQVVLGHQEGRCYTNPIWVIPVKFEIQVTQIDANKAEIPAGALKVKLNFGLSMNSNLPLDLEIKALDSQGNSTDKTHSPLSGFQATGGWSANSQGMEGAIYEASNTDPIPLTGASYPQPGEFTFVIYTKSAPRDVNDNPLNPIAQKFTVNFSNPSQPVVVIPQPITSSNQQGGPGQGSGGSSGGGCTLAKGEIETNHLWGRLLPLLVLLASVVALRRRKLFSQ